MNTYPDETFHAIKQHPKITWGTYAYRLVVCPKNDFTLANLVEDSVDGSVPDEGFRVSIVLVQVVFDGGDEFVDASEDTAAKALLGQHAEPAFDEVEPGGTSGSEVQLEARVGEEPLADRFMFVGGIVVKDDVQGEMGREGAMDAAQELKKFLMPMTAVALSDDLAGEHVQGGKQGGGAVPLVVMGHGAAAARLHGQARLRAVEGLDLALFVHTEHHRLVRGVQIQSPKIPAFRQILLNLG